MQLTHLYRLSYDHQFPREHHFINFIGWFIEQAAAQSMARVALEDMLAGHTAREAMMTDCPRVSPA
ncbi:MAG: hypothetical protein M1305_07150, partial [Candidatus Marsarchaeota archaeon]|nr:hypothetical protein [Candidatus Marsarchaeota archaeon]